MRQTELIYQRYRVLVQGEYANGQYYWPTVTVWSAPDADKPVDIAVGMFDLGCFISDAERLEDARIGEYYGSEKS